MASKKQSRNRLTCCMVVQQLQREYFDWTEDELKTIDIAAKGSYADLAGVIEVFHERLTKANIAYSEMHGITHDLDTMQMWDESDWTYCSTYKEKHFHILIRFKDSGSGLPFLEDIANVIGIEPQYIEKAEKGRFAYSNMLAYLTHVKYEDKHQYGPDDVISKGERCYESIYRDNYPMWFAGRGAVNKKKAIEGIDDLEERILKGLVTRQQVLLTDEYFAIYSRYSRRCDDAFRTYGERRAYKTLRAFELGQFKLSVFFVYGESGSGKTRWSRGLIDRLKREHDYSVCMTAASNPVDDYNGEEILWMDDVRGSAMTASDWLKLLDPYNPNVISARYRNKLVVPRVILITSTKEPVEFFYYCKQMGGGDRSEALDQFMRRIQMAVKVIKADDFEDTKVKLGMSEPCPKRHVYLSTDGQIDLDKHVELTYNFDYGNIEYSFDDSLTEAIKLVEQLSVNDENDTGIDLTEIVQPYGV